MFKNFSFPQYPRKFFTTTNSNGEFSINAEPNDVLQISYVGYLSQDVKVDTAANLTITLESTSGKLNEVVVVGYGTQSRRNITSSIAKLDNKVLANAPRSNVGSALQGTVPGLQVVNSTGQPGVGPVLVLIPLDLQISILKRNCMNRLLNVVRMS